MINSLLTKYTGIGVEKTKDQNYSEAKLELKKIADSISNFDQLINYVVQIEETLQKLSDASINLAEDIDQFFSDAPEEQQYRAKTHLNFSIHFSALTSNFFIPRTEANVFSLLKQLKEEVNELTQLKETIKLLRFEYDRYRAIVNYLSDSAKIEEKDMKEAVLKMNQNYQQYYSLKTQFINAVNNLKENREIIFKRPLQNMICLTSQYMMQVFREVQKYRTTFPPELFVPKNKKIEKKNDEKEK